MSRRIAKIIAFSSFILFFLTLYIARELIKNNQDIPIVAYVVIFFAISFSCALSYLMYTWKFWRRMESALQRKYGAGRQQDKDG